MAISSKKIKYSNHLWRARKRLGLGQKQVRLLLGHQYNGLLSEYEHGFKLPTLETALILEIIYRIPIQVMFSSLIEELGEKIQTKINSDPIAYKNLLSVSKNEEFEEFCRYTNLLNKDNLTQADIDKIRHHITITMRRLAYR